jgi:hypothetical protein
MTWAPDARRALDQRNNFKTHGVQAVPKLGDPMQSAL